MTTHCALQRPEESRFLVICDGDVARKAHQDLFRFPDDVYVTPEGSTDVIDTIAKALSSCNALGRACPSAIHLVLRWRALLQVCLWLQAEPGPEEVSAILREAGMSPDELSPLKAAGIDDLFRRLYHGKRFDILRKVCHGAKRQIESRLTSDPVSIDCHVIAEEAGKIVASSL